MTLNSRSRVLLYLIVCLALVLASCRATPPADARDDEPGPSDPSHDPGPGDDEVPVLPAEIVWRIQHDEGYVMGAAFSPDGSKLAVCGLGEPGFLQTVQLLSPETGNAISPREEHLSATDMLTFSPSGTYLSDGWKLITPGGRLLDGWWPAGSSMVFVGGDSMVAIATSYGSGDISIWNVVPDERQQSTPLTVLNSPHTSDSDWDPVRSLAVSPGGDILAASHQWGTVNLWSISAWELLYSLDNGGRAQGLAFSPSGELLAVVGLTRHELHGTTAMVRLWQVSDGNVAAELIPPTVSVGETGADVAFSPDGSLLALRSGNEVHVWEMPSGTYFGRLEHWIDDFADEVSVIRFSPQNTMLLVGTIGIWGLEYDDKIFDGSLTLWRIKR